MKYILIVLLLLLAHTCEAPMVTSQEVTEEEPLVTREVIVTYYTASIEECGKSDGITASGVRAIEGITVAADDIPLGTVIILDGKEYIVQDKFGGNYRNRIDIYTEDRNYAISRGISRATIIIKGDVEE